MGAGDRAYWADIDGFDEAINDPWVDYIPVFSSAGGSPSIGAGTAAGRYKKIGRTVHMWAYILFGTGANGGTGGWTVTLPVQAASVTDAAWLGQAYLRDTSAAGAGHFRGFVIASSGATTVSLFGGTNAQVTGSVPFTWVATDFLRFSLTYEAAS